jgi:hypothetical protein
MTSTRSMSHEVREETMSTTETAHWIELAKRASDGLEVVLLWDRSSNRVKVAVSDERLCHFLDLDVARSDALSAFHHPFAHAAARLAAVSTK